MTVFSAGMTQYEHNQSNLARWSCYLLLGGLLVLFTKLPSIAMVQPTIMDLGRSGNVLITFDKVPVTRQLFPRDSATNRATVEISGSVSGTPFQQQIIVEVFDGTSSELYIEATQSLAYENGEAPFSLTVELEATLTEYRFVIKLQQDATTASLPYGSPITGIVAGDVFLINGQSNANARRRAQGDFVSRQVPAPLRRFIRSFGQRSDSASDTLNDKQWYLAEGDSNWGSGAIGQWELQLGRLIVEDQGIPVAILNGAVSGSKIRQHQRNFGDPGKLTDNIYGRLLWRSQQASVAPLARALIWHQGEADQADESEYTTNFAMLYTDWKNDYLGLKQIYLFQIRNTSTTCGPANIKLREIQRRLGDAYLDVAVMSTTGIDPQVDGCHFPYTSGYEHFAEHIYGLIARDLYGVDTDPNRDAPNIDYAYINQTDHPDQTEVTLVMRNREHRLNFSQREGSSTGPHLDFRLEGSTVVTASHVMTTGPDLILTFPGTNLGARGVSYVGHSGVNDPDTSDRPSSPTTDPRWGEWITNANGIGLLAFHNVPLSRPPTVSITHPTTGTTISQGGDVVIGADSVDIDGTVVEVLFFANDMFIETDIDSPWEIVWSPKVGTYRLNAVAIDDAGTRSPTSDPVVVMVVNPNGTETITPTPNPDADRDANKDANPNPATNLFALDRWKCERCEVILYTNIP